MGVVRYRQFTETLVGFVLGTVFGLALSIALLMFLIGVL